MLDWRGGMAPCGVIFHENVIFLFVAQKCQVIHVFHKTHKQNVIAINETHILGNFINNMVFGDQRVSTKNEDDEQHSKSKPHIPRGRGVNFLWHGNSWDVNGATSAFPYPINIIIIITLNVFLPTLIMCHLQKKIILMRHVVSSHCRGYYYHCALSYVNSL